jgi:tRNA pseudouridine32 synthase/23S rRNA pseudouridine746 synthase
VTVTWFDPAPRADELPPRLPSPFDPPPPHPLARRAAERLVDELRRGRPLPLSAFEGENRGKMFAVLVVQDGAGRVGFLRGFSGMIGGRWQVEGFVGPLFDPAARDAFWPAGQAELDELDRRLGDLLDGSEARSLREALAALEAEQARRMGELLAGHAERRQRRHQQRARLGEEDVAALRALGGESQADRAAVRRQRAADDDARGVIEAALAALAERQHAVRRERHARSCALLEGLFAGYQIPNGRGERRSLRALFAPEAPPGGAGDCAAPKLFGHAHRHGLRPLALAELWWGKPPASGGRRHGVYYPSCRGKCGPVLGHMLDGLGGAPLPVFGGGTIAADEPRTVFEDRWLLVVDKPPGLLAVPGRGGALRDSVLTRLRARHPGALLAHRLDLDTSGLLLAAKDHDSYVALQRQFVARAVEKRYLAVLEGSVAGEEGLIDLPLRVDLDDRPRQIHDPVHGRAALTAWRVLARAGGRTRVALSPHTGRTHQLRVHAAHPAGLATPIVGDRLYGDPGERLLLHAETLGFSHPHTGAWVELCRPAPF